MNWLKRVLFKVFRGAVETLVGEALDKALTEVHEEIDANFKGDEAEALKSGTFLLKQRITLVLREKL
jgi:hypothetical protein